MFKVGVSREGLPEMMALFPLAKLLRRVVSGWKKNQMVREKDPGHGNGRCNSQPGL